MQAKEEEQQAAAADAVFPVILQIMENCIFNARDPIVLGCEVEEGIAKVIFPISCSLSVKYHGSSFDGQKLNIRSQMRRSARLSASPPGVESCWARLPAWSSTTSR